MKLGNSNSQNKGKIYLKDKSQIDLVFATQTVDFEQWFAQNYVQLQKELTHKRIYDDDILSDTYLKIYDSIMYRGLDIKSFKSYFYRSYYTNLTAKQIRDSKCYETSIEDVTIVAEEIADDDSPQSDILFDTFDQMLSSRESELIKMHYTNQELSIKSIAKSINIPYHTACYIIRCAKNKLRNEPSLLSLLGLNSI